MYLTVIVNSEGHIGSDDVVEADLAVLWGAVGIQSLHPHNPVKQTPFWDWGLVATLNEHGGELVDVVYTHMHGGPEVEERGVGREWNAKHKQGEIDFILTTGSRNVWAALAAHSKEGCNCCLNGKYPLPNVEGEPTCGISCCSLRRVPLRSRRPGWWSCAPAGSRSPAAP